MKFPAFSVAAMAACWPALISAHYYFPYLIVDGVTSQANQYVRSSTQGYQPQLTPDILTSDDLRCNTGSFDSAASTGVAKVNAGDTVSFVTDVQTNVEYPGPFQYYMSQAPSGNVTTYDGSGDWFKVGELGYNLPFTSNGDNWKAWGKNTFDVTIPAEVPAGQYLLRIEQIALHKPSAREMYFSCAQIEVSSSSTATPSPLVKIPGLYSESDPGIDFNMYSSPLPTSYPFPGPAVYGSTSSKSKRAASWTA